MANKHNYVCDKSLYHMYANILLMLCIIVKHYHKAVFFLVFDSYV